MWSPFPEAKIHFNPKYLEDHELNKISKEDMEKQKKQEFLDKAFDALSLYLRSTWQYQTVYWISWVYLFLNISNNFIRCAFLNLCYSAIFLSIDLFDAPVPLNKQTIYK